jgi:hypothetical protein
MVMNQSESDSDVGTPASVPLLIDAKATARLLGVSDRLLWSMTNANEVPHVRVRRRVLYPVNQLREWIAEHTKGGR